MDRVASRNFDAIELDRTISVTIVNNGGGNKYVIDGVQQDSLNLIEGETRF